MAFSASNSARLPNRSCVSPVTIGIGRNTSRIEAPAEATNRNAAIRSRVPTMVNTLGVVVSERPIFKSCGRGLLNDPVVDERSSQDNSSESALRVADGNQVERFFAGLQPE